MKCTKCNGITETDWDRVKCLICGHSIWKRFEVHEAFIQEQNIIGQGKRGVTK